MAHPEPAAVLFLPAPGMHDVLGTTGLTRHELHVLHTRGWDAYQRLVRQRARSKRGSSRRRSRGGSGDLEAVVVVEEGEQADAGAPAGAAEPAGPAAAAEAGADAPPAAEEAGLEPQQAAEERDGVLHTAARLRCRGSGKKCETICQLLRRQPMVAGPSAAAAAAAGPLEAGAPPAAQPSQLQAIAEEDGQQAQQQAQQLVQVQEPPKQQQQAPAREDSPPPSPHSSQAPPPARGMFSRLVRGSVRSCRCCLVPPAAALPRMLTVTPPSLQLSAVGWDQPEDSGSLQPTLSGVSLASSDTPSSPGSGVMGTRGSYQDSRAFPLVFNWQGGSYGAG